MDDVPEAPVSPSAAKRDRLKHRNMELPSTGSTIALGADGVPSGIPSPSTTSAIPEVNNTPVHEEVDPDKVLLQKNYDHLALADNIVNEYNRVFADQRAKILAAVETAKILKALKDRDFPAGGEVRDEMIKMLQQGSGRGERLDPQGYLDMQKQVWKLDDNITKKAEPSIDSVVTADIQNPAYQEQAAQQKIKKKELSKLVNHIQPRYQEFVIIVNELCKEFKSASKSTSQMPRGGQWIDTDYAGPATPTRSGLVSPTAASMGAASAATSARRERSGPETHEFQWEAQDDYVPDSNSETQFLQLMKGRRYKVYKDVPANTSFGGWVYCQALEGSAKGSKGWAPETYLKQVAVPLKRQKSHEQQKSASMGAATLQKSVTPPPEHTSRSHNSSPHTRSDGTPRKMMGAPTPRSLNTATLQNKMGSRTPPTASPRDAPDLRQMPQTTTHRSSRMQPLSPKHRKAKTDRDEAFFAQNPPQQQMPKKPSAQQLAVSPRHRRPDHTSSGSGSGTKMAPTTPSKRHSHRGVVSPRHGGHRDEEPRRSSKEHTSGSSKRGDREKKKNSMPAPPGIKISTGSKPNVRKNPYMEPDGSDAHRKSKGACVVM